jgi:Fe-S-cluster-containing hydrogenase component 2
MSVLINKKVCDNSSGCSCINECPNKAFCYDENKKSVAVKESLCTQCRICMIACEAGAVKVARTEEELFVDRFGASPIDDKYSLNIDRLETLIEDSNKMLLIELYKNDDSIKCLVNSVPIKEIIDVINKEISYRKCEVTDDNQLKQYDISIFPSLLLIKNQKIIGKYEGFCNIKNKEKLLNYFKSLNI